MISGYFLQVLNFLSIIIFSLVYMQICMFNNILNNKGIILKVLK